VEPDQALGAHPPQHRQLAGDVVGLHGRAADRHHLERDTGAIAVPRRRPDRAAGARAQKVREMEARHHRLVHVASLLLRSGNYGAIRVADRRVVHRVRERR
jgi:hypothetical protein